MRNRQDGQAKRPIKDIWPPLFGEPVLDIIEASHVTTLKGEPLMITILRMDLQCPVCGSRPNDVFKLPLEIGWTKGEGIWGAYCFNCGWSF